MIRREWVREWVKKTKGCEEIENIYCAKKKLSILRLKMALLKRYAGLEYNLLGVIKHGCVEEATEHH